jgi:hypothetical protein
MSRPDLDRTEGPVATLVRDYLLAKDGNRPHLIERVFAPDAVLEIVNPTAAIAFPARTEGRAAIGEVLVRDFARRQDNVYTFCLSRPDGAGDAFACGWLVAMTDKAAPHALRVGCGRYAWCFAADPSAGGAPALRANRLTITIDAMPVLPAEAAGSILSAVAALEPWWSNATALRACLPDRAELAPVRQWLERDGAEGAGSAGALSRRTST